MRNYCLVFGCSEYLFVPFFQMTVPLRTVLWFDFALVKIEVF